MVPVWDKRDGLKLGKYRHRGKESVIGPYGKQFLRLCGTLLVKPAPWQSRR